MATARTSRIMPNSEPTPNTRSSRPLISLPRFQFSLAWLLIAVTVVAVVLGIWP